MKLTSAQKNNAIIRLQDATHFSKDVELLQLSDPCARSLKLIDRVSKHTLNRTHASVLNDLLDHIEEGGIVKFRIGEDKEDSTTPPPTPTASGQLLPQPVGPVAPSTSLQILSIVSALKKNAESKLQKTDTTVEATVEASSEKESTSKKKGAKNKSSQE